MNAVKNILLCIAVVITSQVQSQVIITVAGNGTQGYSGDNGPATSAQLSNPFGVAVDANGNLYIADAFNNVIRKVDIAGVITTIAGTGGQGYSGDGGPAVNATLYRPYYVCVDNSNNVYFTDQLETVIRKVNTVGVITTITGNLPAGYSGDGGPLNLAQFGSLAGVCFDNGGNMYITDFANAVIRKVNTAGIISTFAGNGTPGFSGDGGPATSASIRTQTRVAIDNNTNSVYIADPIDNRIRVVNAAGIISTFAGTGVAGYAGDGGQATSAMLNYPWQVATDAAGNVFAADYNNYVIRKINAIGVISTYVGTGIQGYMGDGGPAILAQINDPCGMVCNAAGDIYFAQRISQVIRKVTACPPVLINQQPANITLCNSGTALFTVNTTGATAFQWQENDGTGWSDIANNATYSGALTNVLGISNAGVLLNGYQYRCRLQNACGITYSGVATLTVLPQVVPTLGITTPSNSICTGTNVVFTATVYNEGSAPTYQWKKNGTNVGTSSTIYSDNTLMNGDVITCDLTSNAGCAAPATVTSNSISMTVNSVFTPAVSIATSSNNTCFKTTVTFTATPVNGGGIPFYQWKKNGVNVGTNSYTYIDYALNNGDVIECVMTSGLGCVTTPTALSNQITMQLFQNPVVVLDKTPNLCAGTTRTLDAGNYASYLWSDGSTGRFLTVNAVGNYYVTVTDNNNCTGSDTAKIITLSPTPKNFLPQDTSFCSFDSLKIIAKGNFVNYLWSNNSVANSITVKQSGLFWLDVKDNLGCTGRDSINATSKDCPNRFYVPTAFTPNGDGNNDLFKPLISGNVKKFKFRVYNRWGELIFDSNDKAKGWDGTFQGVRQGSNVFVWLCSYQFEGEAEQTRRGTVVIIR